MKRSNLLLLPRFVRVFSTVLCLLALSFSTRAQNADPTTPTLVAPEPPAPTPTLTPTPLPTPQPLRLTGSVPADKGVVKQSVLFIFDQAIEEPNPAESVVITP